MSEYAITTSRLALDIIGVADKEAVFETMNSPETAEIISFMTAPMTMEQAEEWCRKSVAALEEKTGYFYLARNRDTKAPVGCIGVHTWDPAEKKAEIGYWVSPAHQGQGYAGEMLGAALDFAFNRLGLESAWATAMPSNLKSAHLLEKAGFKLIGKTNKPVASEDKVSERNIFELKNPPEPV